MPLILHIVNFRGPDVIGEAVCGLALGRDAELAGLLLHTAVSLAAVSLHLQDLRGKLLLGHLVDCVLRVLALDLTDDFVVVGGLHALPRLLRRVVGGLGAPRAHLAVALVLHLLCLLDHGARLSLLDRLHVACDLGLDSGVHFAWAVPRHLLDPSLVLHSVERVLHNVYAFAFVYLSCVGAGHLLCYFVRCRHFGCGIKFEICLQTNYCFLFLFQNKMIK